VNMVSQSWDGKRVYITSSLLANWDKKGKDDEQFLKLFAWDGKELTEKWKVDFYQLKLGRAHHMKFGAAAPKMAAVQPQGMPLAAK
jgi:selenium-binding protein 1